MQKHLRHRDTVLIYRATFDRTEHGKKVLVDLLQSTGLLMRIETEEQRVHHNWGVWLLENLGATQGINYERLIDAILRTSIPDEAIVKE